ncbi:MAG: transcription antitermination factor NusB [Pseudomonadota bacterium]|jgi:N utilization substance protein B
MRRKARELALQLLFQAEFSEPLTIEAIVRAHESDGEFSPDIQIYAKELVRGVRSYKAEIDSLIQRHSAHWKLERMATIDRNVLRVAVFEMKFAGEPVSPAIVINEALEIAKIYGGTDSSSFINGLLDQVAKGL